jgi:hypothetical protein
MGAASHGQAWQGEVFSAAKDFCRFDSGSCFIRARHV